MWNMARFGQRSQRGTRKQPRGVRRVSCDLFLEKRWFSLSSRNSNEPPRIARQGRLRLEDSKKSKSVLLSAFVSLQFLYPHRGPPALPWLFVHIPYWLCTAMAFSTTLAPRLVLMVGTRSRLPSNVRLPSTSLTDAARA